MHVPGVKVEVTNQQKIKRLNLNHLRRYIKEILTYLSVEDSAKGKNIPSKSVSILFCDSDCIKALNEKFFKKVHPTDVIAFPLQDDFKPAYLGEVVVSVEEAVIASRKYNTNWEQELSLYIIHGILHLVGYRDHTRKQREVMDKKQKEILRKAVL